MAIIRFKRGTRAQLNTAASGGSLLQGEPYLVTDEGALAIGTSSTSYVDISGGGGGGSWTEIEVDFGANPVSSKTFTVTAPTVSPSSKVTAVLSGKPATGRAPGDADADAFACACTPSSGSFRLAAHCTTGRVVGRRIFQYLIA